MNLEKLISELREEKCPLGVPERVGERIERQKARPLRIAAAAGQASGPTFRRASITLGILAACLVLGIGVTHLLPSVATKELRSEADRAMVVEETRVAFAYIGEALRRAAAQSEETILKEAVPPLRNGFETVKNKVTKPI